MGRVTLRRAIGLLSGIGHQNDRRRLLLVERQRREVTTPGSVVPTDPVQRITSSRLPSRVELDSFAGRGNVSPANVSSYLLPEGERLRKRPSLRSTDYPCLLVDPAFTFVGRRETTCKRENRTLLVCSSPCANDVAERDLFTWSKWRPGPGSSTGDLQSCGHTLDEAKIREQLLALVGDCYRHFNHRSRVGVRGVSNPDGASQQHPWLLGQHASSRLARLGASTADPHHRRLRPFSQLVADRDGG